MKSITFVASAVLLLLTGAEGGAAQVPDAYAITAQYVPQGEASTFYDRSEVSGLLRRQARLRVENIQLRKALSDLASRAGIPIVYSPSQLADVAVTCDCEATTVGQALDLLLKDTGFHYSEADGQILIMYGPMPGSSAALQRDAVAEVPVPRLSQPAATPLVQRLGTITGTVRDASSLEPLAAVQIVVDGTTRGVLSTQTGSYTLTDIPAGTHTVVARRIGYQEERRAAVTVGTGTTTRVDFLLTPTALALDEVVAVGYGQQSRATVSGAISSVSSTELEGRAFSTTSEALHGAVQGLNIRMMVLNGGSGADSGSGQSVHAGTGGRIAGDAHDGRPGAPAVISIRNMGTPLVVIDGVPSNLADFNQLNPADIENISILKDASAAVYGFRAADGVVMITTKRGALQQAPQVKIDGYYGWQNPTRYVQWPVANAYEYLHARVDAENNLGDPTRLVSREELELWRIGAPGYETQHDHTALWNNPNAPQWNFNASLSGGTESVQYYMSGGHIQQEYNLRDFNWGRTNLAVTLRANMTPRLTLGTELRGQQSLRDEPALIGGQNNVMTAMLSLNSSWPHEPTWVGPNNDLINYERNRIGRTLGQVSQEVSGTFNDVRRQGSGNVWAEYKLPFGTTVKGTFSASLNTRDFDLARKAWDAYCHDTTTDTYFACYNSADRTRQQLKVKSDGVFGNLTVNHAFEFGRNSLSATGFWEVDGNETWETWLIGQLPTNYTHLMELSRIDDLGNTWDITRRASLGGRIDYDYDKKYLLTALARHDGSYLYAPGKRWGLFPALSVGWRLTEEPFMRERFPFFTELKLRGSWGQTGREQGVAPWGYLAGATYGVGNGSVLEEGQYFQGARPRGIPVTNLTWVTSTSKDVGVDLAVMNGRLGLEFDLFERLLTGLPAPRADVLIPTERGYGLPNENLNSDVTRGFEFLVKWADRVGNVSYSMSPNMTVSRTQARSRYMQRFSSSWDEYRNGNVGRWAGADFGYEVIGQFQNMDEIYNHPVMIDGQGNRLLLPGDLIYKDHNGDGVIDALDMRPIGYSIEQTPIVSFGGASQVIYNGFTLTANFSGGAGFGQVRAGEGKNPLVNLNNFGRWGVDRWHRADPYNPQSEWIPGRLPPTRGNTTNPSYNRNDSFWRTNVRYVRLRRVELGYSVPNNIAARLGLSGLRVHTNLQNAFTFDNTRHYNNDPELARDAGLSYPTIRLLNVGFNTNLGGVAQPPLPVPVPPTDSDD